MKYRKKLCSYYLFLSNVSIYFLSKLSKNFQQKFCQSNINHMVLVDASQSSKNGEDSSNRSILTSV